MPGPVTGEDLEAAVESLIEAFELQMVASRNLFEAKLDALAIAAGVEGATLRALIAQKADALTDPIAGMRNTIEENRSFEGERLATEVAIAKMPRRHSRIRHTSL